MTFISVGSGKGRDSTSFFFTNQMINALPVRKIQKKKGNQCSSC